MRHLRFVLPTKGRNGHKTTWNTSTRTVLAGDGETLLRHTAVFRGRVYQARAAGGLCGWRLAVSGNPLELSGSSRSSPAEPQAALRSQAPAHT